MRRLPGAWTACYEAPVDFEFLTGSAGFYELGSVKDAGGCHGSMTIAILRIGKSIPEPEHFPITWNRKMLCKSLLCRVFEPENRDAVPLARLVVVPLFLKTLQARGFHVTGPDRICG